MSLLASVKTLLLGVFYFLLSRTWRIRHHNFPTRVGGERFVFAHWHGDELLLIGAYFFKGLAIMVSHSKDGKMLSNILKVLGYRVVRGSSSRGAVSGLKALVEVVRGENKDASLAVDGPRGPLYYLKPGVIKLAQMTGCRLVLGTSASSRRYIFEKAWNKCYLPLPFAQCVVAYSEPIAIPQCLSDSQLEELRLEIEEKLWKQKCETEKLFGSEPALFPATQN